MVTKLYNNRALTAEPEPGGIACFFLVRKCPLFKMFIVTVTLSPVRISVPQKSANKPDKQHQWHNNGHDHVPDLIAEVHKNTHDVKCFCQ